MSLWWLPKRRKWLPWYSFHWQDSLSPSLSLCVHQSFLRLASLSRDHHCHRTISSLCCHKVANCLLAKRTKTLIFCARFLPPLSKSNHHRQNKDGCLGEMESRNGNVEDSKDWMMSHTLNRRLCRRLPISVRSQSMNTYRNVNIYTPLHIIVILLALLPHTNNTNTNIPFCWFKFEPKTNFSHFLFLLIFLPMSWCCCWYNWFEFKRQEKLC